MSCLFINKQIFSSYIVFVKILTNYNYVATIMSIDKDKQILQVNIINIQKGYIMLKIILGKNRKITHKTTWITKDNVKQLVEEYRAKNT